MSTWLAREIAEQPEVIARTLEATWPLRGQLATLAAACPHVTFVARGSSDNACVYGRYLTEVIAGRPAALAAPSVATHYRRRLDLSDTLVVSVSQSGATEEIVATQLWAADCGARTVAVTNEPASPLADGADVTLVTAAGVERAVPATKTYTAQLTALAVLADALTGEGSPIAAGLGRLPEAVRDVLAATDRTDGVEELLAGADHTIVSGRGIAYGTALELALKLEETCARPVRGLSYADLRHGPIAIVGADEVVVLIAARGGPVLSGIRDVATQVRSRGAKLVVVGGDAELAAAADEHLAGPDLDEPLAPIGLIVPGQVVVERLARRLGFDPDAPTGLAKVTQTDDADPRA